MAAIEILRLTPNATLEEVVKKTNMLLDLRLGNDGDRIRMTGYDGVERDLQTGGSLSTGNYQTFIKSAGTNHLQVQHSSGSPDILLVQDAGITGTVLTITGNTTLGDAAGDTLTVNATSTFVAAATFNGNVTLGDASGDTLTVNATATFHAAATFNGNMILGDAAADTLTVNGTMILPAIDPPTVAGQATKASISSGWAYATVSGTTPTLQDSYNVSGIVRDFIGAYTISWDRDFASANYAVVSDGQSGGIGALSSSINAQSVGNVQVAFYDAAGALIDPASVTVIACGLLS